MASMLMGSMPVIFDDTEDSFEDTAFDAVPSTWYATVVVAANPEGIESTSGGWWITRERERERVRQLITKRLQ
jgi:hypothetical protein